MMLRTFAIGVVLIDLLCACSAPHPIPYADAHEVPDNRVFGFARPMERTETVAVRRDVGWAASACLAKLTVNGKPAALMETGEKTTLYVAAGRAVFGAQLNGACAGNVAELALDVIPGRHIGLRISALQTGDVALYESVPE
ncbi:hypothetical protein [Burkholderia ubonensis]|uniref:hypothetical protein n=1 Tax=Burkholderia ubonensis TaxID=101571 RepID=UPI0011612CC7|nr:hypothetical protein [Burkholderia ubonensis]